MTSNDRASERQNAERQNAEREKTKRQIIDRDDIEALLPWHAAGTLRRRDRLRVDEALKTDPVLAQRSGLVREELAETIRLNERLGAPSARALDKLMAAIDEEVSGHPSLISPLLAARWLGGFIASLSPRTIAIAAAAGALAIALEGFALLGVLTKPQSVYQTAGMDEGTPRRGAFALVRFVHQASAGEITKFLETYQATLVDGPTRGGLFRVKVAMTSLAQEELARIIARMQREQVIESVTPTE